ncbi:MAG TPA: Fe-S cluster assembly protein SufD [Solirubrobacterales bacterium]|nr:Fe-S cluster assembly protein SufD [Solirubrobacterales bacterium]
MAETLTEPSWLVERRRKGASRAQELPLPDQKAKGWEFTDLSALRFESFAVGEVEASIEADGAAGDGAVVMPLSVANDQHGELLRERLGSLVSGDDPFVARNDAAWRQGALVYVPAGVRLAEPVRIEVAAPAAASAWRTLIILEEGAEAEVWERWASEGEGDALLNAVVEIRVGDGARLGYVSAQELSQDAWVFATQRAELGRDGSLDWTALGFGSGRGKVRMETNLAGEGSEARVTGAYAGNGGQHLDYDTTQEHSAAHTTSDLAFRGILADRSTAVWRGMIKVDPGAQQTDAFQECRNLLLSHDAHADAIPGLEILANDVRCTHAAAVAQIDRDQLFYLSSRGLGDQDARRLVIDGFLQALVERLPAGEARDSMSAALERRLEEIL